MITPEQRKRLEEMAKKEAETGFFTEYNALKVWHFMLGAEALARIQDSEVALQAKRQVGVTSGERPIHIPDEEAAKQYASRIFDGYNNPNHADDVRAFLAGCAYVRTYTPKDTAVEKLREIYYRKREAGAWRPIVEEALHLLLFYRKKVKIQTPRADEFIARAEKLLGKRDG